MKLDYIKIGGDVVRCFFVTRIPRWYIIFATGIFFVISMLAVVVKPILSDTIPKKPQPFFHGDLTKAKVSLACNVFWGEEFLPVMLDTMDKYNIKVTFFVGGSWAKRYPDILKELIKRGHEIGNHTYSHPHPNALNKEENKRQIIRAEELIEQLTGVKTVLYAPPYGEYNDTVLQSAEEIGYTTIMWSIDTIDWKRPPAEVIRDRVFKEIA